ncbi:cation diffusion facilitator family transporter [Pelagibius sp. Alg239-R121]|uniref:cation diffusion facilitator family transporter n=1 Tax=Pelagibius sp. Alg239-R121 TaxID=2993448 RepID=UPI0024A67DF1|nr:cation diffusion facilitator family transporter [Pelagibius sp. Alg239-R121]
MAAQGSKKVIYAALAGNSLIAITKFTAATFTGSSAMFSEAIHSSVDTGNQALLLYGMRRAERPSDARHPFGYSKEIYFWAFVVAILIFAVGAGVSFYEGVEKTLHPHPVSDVYINYLVLCAAILFEGAAWYIAFKEFKRGVGRRSMLRALLHSKDPSIFTVLLEDTAAMLGLIVALIGIFLADYLNMPVLDGVASMTIGVVLALAAVVLAYETKGLLIGESADEDIVAAIRTKLGGIKEITGINEILTMHMGPADVLVNISIDFANTVTADQIEGTISELESQIKADHTEIKRIFIEIQSRQGHARNLQAAEPEQLKE